MPLYTNERAHYHPEERRRVARQYSSQGGTSVTVLGFLAVAVVLVLAHLTYSKGTGGDHEFHASKCDTVGLQKVMLGIIVVCWISVVVNLLSSITSCVEIVILGWKSSPIGNSISGLGATPTSCATFILVLIFTIWFAISDCSGAYFAEFATAFIIAYWVIFVFALLVLSCVLFCFCCLMLSLGLITAPFALMSEEV